MGRISRSASRWIRFGNAVCLVAALALITSALALATTVQASVGGAAVTPRHVVMPADREHLTSGFNLSPKIYGLRAPFAITAKGGFVWVANSVGNSVTELNASTRKLVRFINGSSNGFSLPYAIDSDGTHVWVANFDGNSVTELNASTGGLAQPVIKGSNYGFDAPAAIASDGTHVWVANLSGTSVTELNASTGTLV